MKKKGEIHLNALKASSHRLHPHLEVGTRDRKRKLAQIKVALADGSYRAPAAEVAERMLAAASR